MSPDILGLVALGSLFIFIFVGFPIAFTLLFLGLVVGYIGIGAVVFNLMTLQVYAIMNEQVLSAVPFFLFMGYILESSGLMERLFRAFQLTMAKVSGSLYIAVTERKFDGSFIWFLTTKLCNAFFNSCIDSSVSCTYGFLIILWNENGHTVFFGTAVNRYRLPAVEVRESCVYTCDNLGFIDIVCHNI